MFLLGGLLRIVQNVKTTYVNQQALAQLQDAQRFAMTVIADVVQEAGYFPTPVTQTAAVAFPVAAPFTTAGQPIFGTHPGGATPDTLRVRYRTALNDAVILCDGSSNTSTAPDRAFINIFTVVPAAGTTPGRLWCSVNNTGSVAAPGVALAEGVQNMVIYYGVKRNAPAGVDYNIDTYLTADLMSATDWMNVSCDQDPTDLCQPAVRPGHPAGNDRLRAHHPGHGAHGDPLMSITPTLVRSQRGMALVSSLLLLMIITLMALAMFRSVNTGEKIAGNLREKDRALHSAEAAQQYGEWWLLQGSNVAVGSITCAAQVLTADSLNSNGQICAVGQNAQTMFGDMTVPANWITRTEYLPWNMSVSGPAVNGDMAYAQVPAFFISDLGLAADGAGEAYQVAAYGFGASTNINCSR